MKSKWLQKQPAGAPTRLDMLYQTGAHNCQTGAKHAPAATQMQQLPPTQLQPKQYAAATAEHSHIRVIRCQLQRSSMCQHRPYSSRHRGRLLKEAHRSLQNSTHNNHAGSNTHAYTHKLLDSDVSSNNRTVSRQCCCCRGLLFSTYAAEVTMVT